VCRRGGEAAQVIYLPPYSPDLNPIEEFFAELKSFTVSNVARVTTKWILVKVLMYSSHGVLTRLVQRKRVLEATFNT
jgi:transposase